MKVALLRNPSSIHIRRWVEELQKLKIDVVLLSIERDGKIKDYHTLYPELKNVKIITFFEILGKNVFQRSIRFIINKTRYRYILHRRMGGIIEKSLLENRVDILHVHGIQYYGQISSYITKITFLVSIWGSDIFHRKKDRLTTSEYQQCFNLAKVVESSSLYAAETALKSFNFDSDKTNVFQWGVNLRNFNYKLASENSESLRKQLKISTGCFVIISQRSMVDLYNWDQILQSTILLPDQFDFHLIMLKGFGTDNNITRAKTFISEKNLSDKITIIDKLIPLDELVSLYAIADAFISIPASDNIADSLIEGMAMKCYPIVSNLKSYQELFSDNNASFVYEYNAKSVKQSLLHAYQRADRTQIVENNYQNVIKNNNWEIVAKKQIKIYKSIIK